MARKLFYNIHEDKVKQCYIQPDYLFDTVSQYEKGEYIDGWGDDTFSLKVIEHKKTKEGKSLVVMALVILRPDNEEVATFIFNSPSTEFGGYCFMTFENKYLYTAFCAPGTNYRAVIPEIAAGLGLQLYSLTRTELACDCNFNTIATFLRLVRDDNVEMIFNGKKVDDPDLLLLDFRHMAARSRKHVSKNQTLHLKQAKSESMEIKMYNKTKEIAESSGKDYVTDWLGYGKQTIFRMELVLKSSDIRKWLEYCAAHDNAPAFLGDTFLRDWCHPDDLMHVYYLMGVDAYKEKLFEWQANRVIRFTTKAGKHISLLDIVKGV